MSSLKDHAQRYALANELHARPFPEINGAAHVYYFALTHSDPAVFRGHLLDLLNRYGATHPAEGTNHFYGPLGRNELKYELHAEFATFTLFTDPASNAPFEKRLEDVFPPDWLANLPGEVITAARVLVQRVADTQTIEALIAGKIRSLFTPESFATAWVLDKNAAIAGDFRIDEAGYQRFAVLGLDAATPRRMGRVVQRVLEIETYKALAMLALPVARKVFSDCAKLDARLGDITRDMATGSGAARETLDQLLAVSSEIELLASTSEFRLSAQRAYADIVAKRIAVLREDRLLEGQLVSEFMMRRFDPAMRTCRAADRRLHDIAERAARASRLLSTRVEVQTATQNRQLLHSMNRRAELQMRLQETVEGLSVVAISYYAVTLLGYLLAPLLKEYVGGKSHLIGLLVIPVMLLVWLMIRRIKARVEASGKKESEEK